MVVSNGQIREIDISGPARALRFLRMTDYLLVIVCGQSLLSIFGSLFTNPVTNGGEALLSLVFVPVLMFLIYTGFRHVGVIDVSVWRVYLVVLPLLILVGLLRSVATVAQLSTVFEANGEPVPLYLSLLGLLAGLPVSVGALVAFFSVLVLRRMCVPVLNVPLVELLRELSSVRRAQLVDGTKITRVNARRGIVLAFFGGVLVITTYVIPASAVLKLHETGWLGSILLRMLQLVPSLGFFLLIRARRYFQLKADSLLTADKRKPILFLRSFADDGHVKFTRPDASLLDFSLETRLSNHFTGFGPFIAIGSPKEPVPQPGAARLILSESEWQAKVMSLMSAASAVVMYAGKSQWVTWELAKLVNETQVQKLILMIPELKGWRRGRRAQNAFARVKCVREAFRDTKWAASLAALQNAQDIRAVLFRSNGSLVVIRSRPRNRDSYHLAALIVHHFLLKENIAMLVGINEAAQDRQFPVDTDIFHIGAAEDNNLTIKDDDYISGHHALLRYERGDLSIADQHSKNGTFVNGNRLGDAPVTVNVGDQIRMGHSTFEVAHAGNKNRARAA